LNRVDIEVSLFGGQHLGRRWIAKLAELHRQAKARNHLANRDRITIKSTFTGQLARLKLICAFKESLN
jgi:hypothetical protein